MGLKIFGNADGENAPRKKTGGFQDDVVGRFRSGYVENDRPVALQDWRVTTGDPEVAEKLVALLGAPKGVESWETKGEDNLELFTETGSVEVILDGPKALRQAMVLYGRKGIIRVSDGETITYPDEDKGKPDPQAGQSFQERKAEGKKGTGAEPRIELWFRLAADPELGIFKFQSGSWSLVSDLSYNDTEQELSDFSDDGDKVSATLTLEEVSFIAKTGDRTGQEVRYTKPVLTLNGKVAA